MSRAPDYHLHTDLGYSWYSHSYIYKHHDNYIAYAYGYCIIILHMHIWLLHNYIAYAYDNYIVYAYAYAYTMVLCVTHHA